MRGALARLAAILAVGAGVATAEDRPLHLQDIPLQIAPGDVERRDERSAEFEIVVESMSQSGFETVAKVRVKNLASFTLDEVELHCTAFADAGRELSTQPWKLSEASAAKLGPQETIAVTLRFDTRAAPLASLTCNARGW